MADHRHKRDTNARRLTRMLRRPRAVVVAGPLAVLATVGFVSVGVATSDLTRAVPTGATGVSAAPASAGTLTAAAAGNALTLDRLPLSRAASRADKAAAPSKAVLLTRPSQVATAIRQADTRRYTTAALNLWATPAAGARQDGEIQLGTKVLLTGRSFAGRDEVVTGPHETRWVTSGYLSKDKPLGLGAGVTDAPCPDSGPEYRLTSNAVLVYRTVCHAFPQITAYGGYDAHGEHASGKALDIMTSDPALLTAIADFLRAHADELHLYDVIRMQHIWTPVRSSEGWRLMPDRGSVTANHYDHVHVSTY